MVYKVYSLKRQYLDSSSSVVTAAGGADSAAPTKSKRQMKREKRGENQVSTGTDKKKHGPKRKKEAYTFSCSSLFSTTPKVSYKIPHV